MNNFTYACHVLMSSCGQHNRSQTHICLDELRALLSYLRDKPKHIHFLLCVHHVDHGIYYNEGSCPPNTSTGDAKQNTPQSSADTHFNGQQEGNKGTSVPVNTCFSHSKCLSTHRRAQTIFTIKYI